MIYGVAQRLTIKKILRKKLTEKILRVGGNSKDFIKLMDLLEIQS